MKDKGKTKAQLIEEIAVLRQRVAELEAERQHTNEVLRESEARLSSLVDNAPYIVFMGQLASAIHSAKRYGHPLSLCLYHLDNLKWIDDTYGSRMGDEIIAKVGGLIKKELRTTDILGRLGDDKFYIIFPHTSVPDASISIERIHNLLEKQVFSIQDSPPLETTGTFGIKELSSKDMDEIVLFEATDEALREARALGGNRIVVKKK
ncbi:GGDEF domain-containing protein [Candidatus Poribacteria bacterium]|nr:GGDEF domain-containing protein [Candidatus Poribacteria bacterium]